MSKLDALMVEAKPGFCHKKKPALGFSGTPLVFSRSGKHYVDSFL